MWRYKYVSQIDMRDCGVAALASIAKHYGSHFSLAHLRELAKTSKEGTTALGIVEAAKLFLGGIQMNTKTFEQFDVMTEAELSTVEGGKSFFYDFGYWYGSHASLSNLANNLGRMLRS